MAGFLRLRLRPWIRRLVTRGLALLPTLAVTIASGDRGAGRLLIASQVILSLQLGFAVVPLVHLTSDRRRLGTLALTGGLRAAAWVAAVGILAVNAFLLWSLIA
jgi:manganese transport protein